MRVCVLIDAVCSMQALLVRIFHSGNTSQVLLNSTGLPHGPIALIEAIHSRHPVLRYKKQHPPLNSAPWTSSP